MGKIVHGLRMLSVLIAAVAVIAQAGCLSSSPAPRYYTLDMSPSEKVHHAGCSVAFEDFETAAALDRRNILIKTSGTEAEYYARDQWLGELEELVRDKLNLEFSQAGNEMGPLITVSGKILSFEQVDLPDGSVAAHIKLKLSFFDGQSRFYDQPVYRRVYEVTETPDDSSASSVVEALSKGLERIAGDIGTTLETQIVMNMDPQDG